MAYMTTRTPKLGPLGRTILELDKKGIHPQFQMRDDGATPDFPSDPTGHEAGPRWP